MSASTLRTTVRRLATVLTAAATFAVPVLAFDTEPALAASTSAVGGAGLGQPGQAAGAGTPGNGPGKRLPVDSRKTAAARKLAAVAEAATAKAGSQALAVQALANMGTLGLTAAPATANAANGGGDYRATPLSASSSWTGGGSSGAFTWSYPMRVPPTAAGPTPSLSVTYDSSRVDGRVSNSNNQTSMLGEGFDVTSSYITRQYQPCKDDGQSTKHDLCWKFDNALLVLNGASNELVPVSSTQWKLKRDDGTKVERLNRAGTPPGMTAGTSWNGDDNSEYWVVTTPDGVKYSFGMNYLPGAAAGATPTRSTWTVPVFGDDSTDPCYHKTATTFAGSWCQQAWRWNLDLVQDLSGNASSYWYMSESNYYARDGATSANTSYHRGGYPVRIDYGQRTTTLYSPAPQSVNFSVLERCLTTCTSLTPTTKANWPDVPFDSICASGGTCTGKASPTFFTRKRVTGVTTKVLKAGTPTTVDTWSFTHAFLDPGDTGDATDQSLWLSDITHAGLPKVTLTHAMKPNRVDGTSDNFLPVTKPRLYTIKSETGALTVVNYYGMDCSSTSKPVEDNNSRRCFPSYWNKNGATTASIDWFHKYPVQTVEQLDVTGGNPSVFTQYTYAQPAWHRDRSPLTKTGERTWSDWRGFQKVTTVVGRDTMTSKSVAVFMQGMSGDSRKDGTSPAVSVTGVTAPAIDDSDQYAGFTRETVTYDGSDAVTGTINTPWSHEFPRYQYPNGVYVTPARVDTQKTVTRERVTSGSPRDRTRTVTTSFDDTYFMPETVSDAGDDAITGDETCTRTWYARNTSLNILEAVSRTRVLAVPCSAEGNASLPTSSASPGDVISDTATAYDGDATTKWTANQAITLGRPTWTGRASEYASDGTPTWDTVTTAPKANWDTLGRPLVTFDAAGNQTTTAFVPTGNGPMTSTSVTNAKTHKTTTVLDPAWGLPTSITDPNNRVTTIDYDTLGRATAVWLPSAPKGVTGSRPAHAFGYSVSQTAPSWTSSTTAVAGYSTSYAFVDSLTRPIQTQAPSPDVRGGTIITDTIYDDRGNTAEVRSGVWQEGAPSGTRVGTTGIAPTIVVTDHDGANRPTTSTLKGYGYTKWSTTTAYYGDSTTTTAPTGGSATRHTLDVRGRVTERATYASPQPTGARLVTTYTYTPGGQPDTITGPDGSTWTSTYDLLGRLTESNDPDSGKTTRTYTNLDQIASVTDARGKTVVTGYDEIGRVTGTWDGTKTDATQLTARVYDTLAKGHPSSATRYIGGKAGKAYTRSVTGYDIMYRPETTRLTLPSDDPLVTAGVPAAIDFSTGYNTAGLVTTIIEPALGGLPKETITPGYTSLNLPTSYSGATGYVQAATYDSIGQLTDLVLGQSAAAGTPKVTVSHTYEPTTNRLAGTTVSDNLHSNTALALAYSRDDAGNVTKITDQGGSQTDPQCFAYDGHQRLLEAWTPASNDCTTARDTATLTGPAPYWTSWTYNTAGERDTQTEHLPAGDRATTYTYGGTGQPRHAITGTTTTGPNPGTSTYSYDAAGSLTNRPGPTSAQTLTWDTEGKLDTVSATTGDTSGNIYDADGNLLIRRATGTTGETVLYAGATEVHLTTGATPVLKGQRSYTFGGSTIAVRTATTGVTGSQLSFIAGNNHATASVAIDATTLAVTRRHFAPFGAPRGTQTAWIDDKGFLGKPVNDTTGLTHIGAREFDPLLGAFISVDPILDTSQPQTMGGYSYAGNSPITKSDPTGLKATDHEFGEAADNRGAIGPNSDNPKYRHYGNSYYQYLRAGRGNDETYQPGKAIGVQYTYALWGMVVGTPEAAWHQATTPIRLGGQCVDGNAQSCANLATFPGLDFQESVEGVQQIGRDVENGEWEKLSAQATYALALAFVFKGSIPKGIPAGTPSAANSAKMSGRLQTESAFGDRAMQKALNAKPEPGFFDVVGHGTPFDVSGMSASELASSIRSSYGWNGQNVRLVSCSTGCPVSTFAQSLADDLGVTVRAPSVDFTPTNSGNLVLDPGGSWFTFTPRN